MQIWFLQSSLAFSRHVLWFLLAETKKTFKGGVFMTSNQIEYAKHLENVRHNQATESQASRELGETTRHNKQSEYFTGVSTAETVRHNKEQESINWFEAANLAGLQAAQAEAQLRNAASNEQQAAAALSQAASTQRRVEYDYEIASRQADIAQQNADTAWQNALLAGVGLGFTQESNAISRSNAETAAASQSETRRHNKISEIQNVIGQASDYFTGLNSAAGRAMRVAN